MKYGINNFKWEVIDTTCQNIEELNEMEFHYIKQYQSREYQNGYNLTNGGENNSGRIVSDITRNRLSKAHKGKTIPYETRMKISNTLKGRIISEETRNKISNSNKGKIFTYTHKQHIKENHHDVKGNKNPMYGKTHTKESKILMSKNSKGGNHPMYGVKGENHPLSKEYIITDVDGNTSNIKGLRKFCSDNNLDHCAMRRVAQGKQKQHKGWLCKHYETQ